MSEDIKIKTVTVTTTYIDYQIKNGGYAQEKLEELCKSEWGIKLNNDYEKLWIDNSENVYFDVRKLKEFIKEAEEYGKKENEEFDKSYNKMKKQDDRLEDLIDDNDVIFSVSDVTLEDVAAEGEVVFVCEEYKSRPVTNPTWLDVVKFANESIRINKDFHHVYLEAIIKQEDTENTYELIFGS